jgi:dihydrofolate synthase/folylpolyglutamate synthase
MASQARLEATLARLERLHPRAIDLSLRRIERLLTRLDEPQRRLPPVVHVAGTNGKGSTIAYMRAALEAAGQRCHVYTSPHLVRFNERIRLAGRLIEDEPLIARLEAAERALDGEPITFFEITTAAAFLAFAEEPADWLLLEVGLGGRLDATNVVERPQLCAITPVSLDHQHYLGETLAEIASEKAGILKAGVPAAIAPQPPEAMAAIERRAAELGAPLLSGEAPFPLPEPALPGAHQRVNAALAAACLKALGVADEVIRKGVAGAEWPARLQRLSRGPLVEALPPGSELWLDGGHNPAAGEALAATLAAWPRRPLRLVWGMLSTKDPAGFLAPFRSLAPEVRCVAVPGHAGLPPDELTDIARNLGFDAAPAADPAAALGGLPEGGRALICGSLYLAGEVLAQNG